MKKNYFMLALASMMMAACANNDLVDEGIVKEETPQAIEFETFAQKATRAENSDETYTLDLNDHHESFKVWGYKNVQTNYVFDGKKVSYVPGTSGTSGTWGYEGLVYWDKAATSYDFYAAAPATEGLWTLNKNTSLQADDYFTIGSNEEKVYYTVTAHNNTSLEYANSFAETTNAEDLMIAESNTVKDDALFTSPVQLNFTHILSRLNITVSKDASMASQTVKLMSLTLSNVNNVGTFNENATLSEGTLKDGTHERWTLTANDDKTEKVTTYSYTSTEGYELKYVTNVVDLLNNDEDATDTAEYMLQSLIMPQTAALEPVNLDGKSTGLKEPYFTIVYKIIDNGNTEQFSASYNLASAFGVTGTNILAFNEGWQNTLNITILPSAIQFTGKVATWDNYDATGDTNDDELTIN